MSSKKLKFKIGEKVVYKLSRLGIVYSIYSYTTYKGGRYSYTINTDDEYDSGVYPYQLRKYKKTIIGLNTSPLGQ